MSLFNQNRFFSKVLPYIGNKSRILDELIENASRANATSINIQLSKDKLITENDGDVLSDWPSLLTVASSGHSDLIKKSQLPAGMGIMMMLSATRRAVFHSGNTRIEIDCIKFFDSGQYRMDIESALHDTDSLAVDEYVDGMRCEFDDKNDFFDSLLNPKEMTNKFEYTLFKAFKYYPINITLNGEAIKKHQFNWLCLNEGSGVLSGCQVGIENNHFKNGYIYWFGKKIKCDAISPFSVVVKDKTPVIKPSLPDRTEISNNEAELGVLKRQMENLCQNDIAKMVKHLNDESCNLTGSTYDVVRNNYECIFSILKKLNLAFDVEHFLYWVENNNYVDMAFLDDIDLCTEDIENFHFDDSPCEYVPILPKNLSLVEQRVGGCRLPESFACKLSNRIEIQYVEHSKNENYSGGFGDVEAMICSSITANGIDIEFWYDENIYQVLIHPSAGIDFLVDAFIEHFSQSDDSVPSGDYWDDWDGIQRTLSGKVSIEKFMTTLFKLAGSPNKGIKSATIDLEKGLVGIETVGGDKLDVGITDSNYWPYRQAS